MEFMPRTSLLMPRLMSMPFKTLIGTKKEEYFPLINDHKTETLFLRE